jgi:hypothetical protein
LGDFDETWYKERSQCGDVHIVREVLSNYFSMSYGPWKDFDEAWYKERSQCGDVHFVRGAL